MNRWKLLVLLSVVPFLAGSLAFGQASINYGGWTPNVQSRNIPAGTVVDPGSQLLYIVDTGVNVMTSQFTNDQRANNNVSQLVPTVLQAGGTQTNFISVTNTHPTKAVTVHFRYFNDACEDVLDFLVILTCDDTLIFDPFNFNIPGALLNNAPINTKSRIFGPDLSSAFPAIKANVYRTGRFLIFATAAGTTTDGDFDAEIRFPFEAPNTHGLARADVVGKICNINTGNTGAAAGLVPTNLHVFNASAVVFNYLTGHQTIAVPKGFIQGAQSDQDAFLAYGVNAWTRPAVLVPQQDTPVSTLSGWGDNDGVPLVGDVVDYTMIAGSELHMKLSDTNTDIGSTNFIYLRNEVHGGDSQDAPTNFAGGQSDYGALAWAPLATTEPANQRIELLSFVDDYDGSKNTTQIIQGVNDRSYNLTGAETRYILQVYDQKEIQLELTTQTPINISPPPAVPQTANLRILVDCLRVWINNVRQESNLRPGLSVANLYEITDLIRTGGDGATPLGAAASFAGLGATINPLQDAAQGWVRLVRDNNHVHTKVVNSVTVSQFGGTIAPDNDVIMDLLTGAAPSFVTVGQIVLRFEGFGASWWAPSAAFNPAVSDAPETDPSPGP